MQGSRFRVNSLWGMCRVAESPSLQAERPALHLQATFLLYIEFEHPVPIGLPRKQHMASFNARVWRNDTVHFASVIELMCLKAHAPVFGVR